MPKFAAPQGSDILPEKSENQYFKVLQLRIPMASESFPNQSFFEILQGDQFFRIEKMNNIKYLSDLLHFELKISFG